MAAYAQGLVRLTGVARWVPLGPCVGSGKQNGYTISQEERAHRLAEEREGS